MHLIFFNQDNELIGITNFQSLTWTRKFYETGTFAATLSATEKNVILCRRGNRLYIKEDNPDSELGIIQTVIETLNSNGTETIQIAGSFSEILLSQRICWDRLSETSTRSMIAMKMLLKNAIAPYDEKRKIPKLSHELLSTSVPGWVTKQETYGNVLAVVQEMFKEAKYGSYNRFDVESGIMYFNAKKGVDRTSGQAENTPALFSRSINNVIEQTYTETNNGYYNCALIGGEGEYPDRILTTVGNDTEGLDRYETFISASDVQKTVDDTTLTDEEYEEALQQEGREKLAESEMTKSLEGTYRLNEISNAELGDTVTVYDKTWNVQMDTQITAISKTYSAKNTETTLTFGNKVTSIFKKINKIMNGD
ncbi:MAG: siphovirus ReqiPepy6 Gp37-like family protein [Parabacteroides sp.]